MTSPAGSITLGLALDGTDLATEITNAVTEALRPVLADVQRGVTDINSALGGVNSAPLSNVGDSARRTSSDLDDAAAAARRAAGSTDDVGESARRTSTQTDQNTRSTEENTRSQRDQEQQNERTGGSFDGLGEKIGGAAGAIAGLAAGAAGVGGLMEGIQGAIEQADIQSTLKAKLNLTGDEAAKAGKIAGKLYGDNFGEDMGQVSEAVDAVVSSLGNLTDDSPAAIESMTASALSLSQAFGVDVAEAAQSANQLIRNGLAKDGPEAFDLITAAMQNVPAQMRDEIFPVMDEYGTYFQSIGLSGTEAMGLIVNAAQQGSISMDKAGDAIKEFGIRATDLGDKGAQDALKGIGLDGAQMANELLAGGDRAQVAFQKIVGGLQGIKDPGQQAAAAVALFGTPLEDLDKAKIPGFLAGLSNTGSALGDVSGRATELGNTLAEGPTAKMQALGREIQQSVIDKLGAAAGFVTEHTTLMKGAAIAVGALVAAYVAYRAVAAISAVISGVSAAIRGVELATNAAAGAQRAFTFATVAQGVATKAAAGFTWLLTAAQTALSAVLRANPIILIVTAIAALVAGLVLFFTKTELGRKIWAAFMDAVKVAWSAIVEAFKSAWAFIQPIFEAIGNWVTGTLVPAFQSFWRIISDVFSSIGSFISEAWTGVIMPVFQAVASFIMDVIVAAFMFLWQNVIGPVFVAIGAIILLWWEGAKLVFEAWRFVIMEVIVPAVMWLWQNVIVPAFEGIGAAISFAWTTLIMPIFDLFKAGLSLVGDAAMWLWNNVIVPAWNGIGAAISFVWNSVLVPLFDLIKAGVRGIGDVAMWLWNNAIVPAWNGIGAAISFAWNSLIKPVLDFFMNGIRGVGDIANWLWNNAIKPAWDGIGAAISFVWENVIKVAFEALKSGLRSVGDFFGSVVDGIRNVWDGLKSLLAKPINFLINTVYNGGIKKAWDKVAEFLPGMKPAPALTGIPEHATGGKIRGPGGIDNVLMWGTANEHMLTVSDVVKAGGHSAVYAIRDMIQKGIPFEWNNGQLRPTARSGPGFNVRDRAMQEYGRGVELGESGRIPQGILAAFRPKGYKDGGAIEPWMLQLKRAHEFARKYSPLPYLAGNQLPAGADCSGWMSAIANVIVGGSGMAGNGHWSTVAFPAGQGGVTTAGGVTWYPGLAGNTFSIGMLGGPASGGQNGHTRGTLSGVLGIPTVNVESGGGTGQGPTYGGSAQSAAGMPGAYHMKLGPNGFFEGGSGATGPSPEEQRGFIEKKILSLFDSLMKPAHEAINDVVGTPPPEWRDIPHKFLKRAPEVAIDGAKKVVGGLGDALGGAWAKATDLGSSLLDAVFDEGGVARGTGVMRKDVIAPERVLSPRQTDLFETLVSALSSIASGPATPSTNLSSAVQEGFVNAAGLLGFSAPDGSAKIDAAKTMSNDETTTATGQLISDTRAILERTSTSSEQVAARQHEATMNVLGQVANQLSEKVLVPVVQTGLQEALKSNDTTGLMNAFGQTVGQTAGSIVAASVSAATVSSSAPKLFDQGGAWESGTLGANLSGSVERVLDPSQTRAFDAGLLGGWNLQPQQQHMAAMSTGKAVDTGTLGGDLFGLGGGGGSILSLLVQTLVQVIGIEIEVRNTLQSMSKEVRSFRGDFAAFDASGRLNNDTSGLIDRSSSSRDLVANERMRVLKQIVSGVLKFLITNVLIPMIQAGISALISGATTAIGGAIGTAIGGPLGTAVGGGIGAVVGAGLSGLASMGVSAIGSILSGSVDSLLGGVFGLFDSGGVANGVGLMPKAVLSPERVLSPHQTASFDRLVDAVAGGRGGDSLRSTTVHAPITVQGEASGDEIQDKLLELMG